MSEYLSDSLDEYINESAVERGEDLFDHRDSLLQLVNDWLHNNQDDVDDTSFMVITSRLLKPPNEKVAHDGNSKEVG